jgi:hypothetical protein
MSKRDVRDMLGLEKDDADAPKIQPNKQSKKAVSSLAGESAIKGKVAVGKLAKKSKFCFCFVLFFVFFFFLQIV